MNKLKATSITAGIALIFLCVVTFYGSRMNNLMADIQELKLQHAKLPTGVERVETEAYAGKMDGKFAIYASMAVKTDMSLDELKLAIQSIPELRDAEVVSYTLEEANRRAFTGVQKELDGQSTAEGYYLLTVSSSPVSIWDKRKI